METQNLLNEIARVTVDSLNTKLGPGLETAGSQNWAMGKSIVETLVIGSYNKELW